MNTTTSPTHSPTSPAGRNRRIRRSIAVAGASLVMLAWAAPSASAAGIHATSDTTVCDQVLNCDASGGDSVPADTTPVATTPDTTPATPDTTPETIPATTPVVVVVATDPAPMPVVVVTEPAIVAPQVASQAPSTTAAVKSAAVATTTPANVLPTTGSTSETTVIIGLSVLGLGIALRSVQRKPRHSNG